MTDKPLKGLRVIILRPEAQAVPLAAAITAKGGQAQVLPMLEIKPLSISSTQIDAWVSQVPKLDYYFVTSINAVESLPEPVLFALQQNPQAKAITMGQATTEALSARGLPVFHTPLPGSTSEKLLAEAFWQPEAVAGKEIAILKGVGGRTLLSETLSARGAKITEWVLYERLRPATEVDVDALTPSSIFMVTSLSMLENLWTLSTPKARAILQQSAFVVISTRLYEAARALGLTHVVQSAGAGVDAILLALEKHRNFLYNA